MRCARQTDLLQFAVTVFKAVNNSVSMPKAHRNPTFSSLKCVCVSVSEVTPSDMSSGDMQRVKSGQGV